MQVVIIDLLDRLTQFDSSLDLGIAFYVFMLKFLHLQYPCNRRLRCQGDIQSARYDTAQFFHASSTIDPRCTV